VNHYRYDLRVASSDNLTKCESAPKIKKFFEIFDGVVKNIFKCVYESLFFRLYTRMLNPEVI